MRKITIDRLGDIKMVSVEQGNVLIDIATFGIIFIACLLAIANIPMLVDIMGPFVIIVMVASILGLIGTSGLIYASVKDLNEMRGQEK
jgi:hypothetical protein